jgi:hypothetical protein
MEFWTSNHLLLGENGLGGGVDAKVAQDRRRVMAQ